MQDTFWWVEHTKEVLQKATKVEKLVIDMETGQRGFLIAGKEEFLEPYNIGKKNLPKVLNELMELVSDNPPQVERIIEISDLIDEWQEQAGIFEIELRRKVNRGEIPQSEVVSAIASKRGKNLMDNLRAKLEYFKSVEIELMTTRKQTARDSFLFTKYLIIFGSIAAIVFSFLVFSRIARKITTPILSLVNISQRVSLQTLTDDFIPRNSEENEGEGEISELVKTYHEMLNGLRSEIVKRKSAEEELKNAHYNLKLLTDRLKDHSEKLEKSNEELESFNSMASHDLQEPLRKIVSFGTLLKEEANNLDDQSIEYINKMLLSTKRMQALINDLLELSRVTTITHPLVPVNLNQIVKEVLEDLEIQMAETKGTIHIENLPTLQADAMQMRQLFQNLIGNSIKYHRNEVPPEIHVKSQKVKGSFGEILFIDFGIGFDGKHADRIFKPFERLHGKSSYSGTGMGLAICKKIVDRHKGTLKVKSTLGEGSEFIVTLPEKQSPF